MYLVCRLLLAPAASHIYTLSLHDALPISELAVEDEGPGIAPAQQGAVFERFYRVEGGVASGSGLGLAIAKELARLMDGSVRLESRPCRTVDRKSTRLNSSHRCISYAVFCLRRLPPTSTLFPYTTLFRSLSWPWRTKGPGSHPLNRAPSSSASTASRAGSRPEAGSVSRSPRSSPG